MLSIHTKHDGVVIADVSLSTMERPHSGPTAVVIAVQPVPGSILGYSRGGHWNRVISLTKRILLYKTLALALLLDAVFCCSIV